MRIDRALPLHYACATGHAEAARLLLEAGGREQLTVRAVGGLWDGQITPVDIAKQKGLVWVKE